MKLGMVGQGRMGGNMTERLRRAGHEVMTHDPRVECTAATLEELVAQLEAPRVVWLMVPSGPITEETFQACLRLASAGDTIVDGGNSNFRDSVRRHEEAAAADVRFVDAGISGGVWGLENGYCTMVGGDREAVEPIEPFLRALAPEGGYAHVGTAGAGHFAKMVHNGIEYAMMQAYAEGFELMRAAEFGLDLEQVAGIWRYGSVVRSWLLELLHEAFSQEGNELEHIRGYVEDSGEGRWTVLAAIDRSVPAPVITTSLFQRFASRQDESFAAKVNAALRNQFGGHSVKRA